MPQPDASSLELAERLGVHVANVEVSAVSPLSPHLTAVTFRGDAVALAGEAGQDVMVRVTLPNGESARRRYSVRAVDAERDQLTLWINHAHDGPGANYLTQLTIGDRLDLVGPRGKIFLDPLADWHLFVGDLSAFGAFYRLADAIEPPGRVIFIVEVDDPHDAVTTTFDEGLGVTGIFVDRQGRSANDPEGLLRGLAAFAFPPDDGHAYLFGEFSVMKTMKAALLDRGLSDEAISSKAFWRAGRANASHGEPDKS